MRLIALMALLPVAAQAESLRCVSQGYCTIERECFDDGSVFILTDTGKGPASFGWEGDYTFHAVPQRVGVLTIYDSRTEADSIQTLVVSAGPAATFSISAMFDGELYTSLQSLQCERM